MEAAWQHFKQMSDQGHLAHAHLVIGAPALAGRSFSLLAAKYMLCQKSEKPDGCQCPSCHRVDAGSHGDFHWVEPQGKSRQILTQQIEEILRNIYSTSFEGGWKVFAISYAERIGREAGNKLLKALEEPPDRTLILLLSSEPQSVLGTLVSRCQKLTLHDASEVENPFWYDDLFTLLRQGPPLNHFASLIQGAAYAKLFERVKAAMVEKVEKETAGGENLDEDMIEARATAAAKEEWAAMFGHMTQWYRDLYVMTGGGDVGHLHHSADAELLRKLAAGLTHGGALRRLENIDRISHRIERFIPVQVAFETLLNES
jgi:DNA polymerase-3 subunit delta'